MANQILIKRSSVAAKVPAAADLQLGELAINTNDGKLFLKRNDGTEAIVEVGAVTSVAGRTGAVSLTNSDVGLGNVENKSSATIRDEITSSNVTTALGYTPVNTTAVGTASGVASLGSDGKVPSSQLPAIAITDTYVVASQADMLALTAQTGDVAVRSDLNKTFILKGASASTLADWQEMLTPTDAVQSVNGKTGSITLTTSDITEGTNKYYTDALASAAAPVQSVAGRTGAVVLTNADVGLSLVENKSSATIRSEITPADIVAADGFIHQVDLSSGVDLNTIKTTGWYHQNTNANTTSTGAANYPVSKAGKLEVHADGSMVYQTYVPYDGTAMFRRTFYNSWAAWAKVYDTTTVVDVIDGGTGATTAASALTNLGAAPIASPTFTGVATAQTLNTTGFDANGASIRMRQGGYGAMLRNDGANTYFLLTAAGDENGTWTAARPLSVNNTTGAVTLDSGGTGGVSVGGNLQTKTLSVGVNAAVAAAGTTQADGTGLTTSVNVVTSGTGGVRLPTAEAGLMITVINTLGTAINVYPATGGQIDTQGANVAFPLGSTAKLQFVAVSETQWYALNGVYA